MSGIVLPLILLITIFHKVNIELLTLSHALLLLASYVFEIVLSLNTSMVVLNCVKPFGSVNSLPTPVSIKLLVLPTNTPVVSLNAIPLI